MEERDYNKLLTQLVAGEIDELVIEQPEFLLFRESWNTHPNRKEIVGEAGLEGKIVYRFQP